MDYEKALKEVNNNIALAVNKRRGMLMKREIDNPVYKHNHSVNSLIGGQTQRINKLKSIREHILRAQRRELVGEHRW